MHLVPFWHYESGVCGASAFFACVTAFVVGDDGFLSGGFQGWVVEAFWVGWAGDEQAQGFFESWSVVSAKAAFQGVHICGYGFLVPLDAAEGDEAAFRWDGQASGDDFRGPIGGAEREPMESVVVQHGGGNK